jgi:hypothetical protein
VDGGWEGVWQGTVADLLTLPSGTAKSIGNGVGIYEGQHYFGRAVISAAGTTAAGYLLVL